MLPKLALSQTENSHSRTIFGVVVNGGSKEPAALCGYRFAQRDARATAPVKESLQTKACAALLELLFVPLSPESVSETRARHLAPRADVEMLTALQYASPRSTWSTTLQGGSALTQARFCGWPFWLAFRMERRCLARSAWSGQPLLAPSSGSLTLWKDNKVPNHPTAHSAGAVGNRSGRFDTRLGLVQRPYHHAIPQVLYSL